MGLYEDFIYVRSYSRWIPELKRRETYVETVDRFCNFIFNETRNCNKIPAKTKKRIRELILNLEIAPSMRLMWSAGENVKRDNIAAYNCAAMAMHSLECFGEMMYILLAGAGCGYSVEDRYVSKLPVIKKQKNRDPLHFVIPDTKLGWKQAIDFGVSAWVDGRDAVFGYEKIRPAGTPLVISGGYASGSAALQRCIEFLRETFINAQERQLEPLEVSDINNEIGNSVICGGVRRSSQACLSDVDDLTMRDSKQGNFNPRRFMANISGVYRKKPNVLDFAQEFINMGRSGSGERGIYNLTAVRKRSPKRRDKTQVILTNPCFETTLRDMQCCNLSEAVVRAADDFDDMVNKIKAVSWLGAIQSTLSYFPVLRPEWTKNAEEERLMGVSITGLCDNMDLITPETLRHWRRIATKTAEEASKVLDINMPAAITLLKPSGCRPWDSITTTTEGLLTLEELFVEHPSDKEWAPFNKDIKVIQEEGSEAKILQTYHNGPSELVYIKMNYGLQVKSTLNHKWFVKSKYLKNNRYIEVNDWKRADEVEKNDILDIVIGNYKKESSFKFNNFNSMSIKMRSDCDIISQPVEMNEDIAWFLGYLWGDGAMSPGKYRIRFIDEHVNNLEKIRDIVKKEFNLDVVIRPASQGRNASYIDIASKMLWHWLLRNDVWKYFAEKIDIIPYCIRASSRNDILAFFAGLLDADGWSNIEKDSGGVGRATITTASKTFAEHIQSVGWSVGVTLSSSLNSCGENLQKTKEMYLMALNSGCDSFAMEVVVRNSSKLQKTFLNPLFRRWAWENTSSNNYIIGKVKEVIVGPVEETYDIEIEGSPWYFNGAVKSHNTVSQRVDCSSGLHSRWAKFYIRRVRISTHDSLFKTMVDQGMPYELDKGNHDTAIFPFPIKSPEGAKLREQDTAIGQLEWYKMIVSNFCDQNASCTIYIKDEEWIETMDYIYRNWDTISGVSFFPYSNKKYDQPPYEEIDELTYKRMVNAMPEIDLTRLCEFEDTDNTEGASTLACSSATGCEI